MYVTYMEEHPDFVENESREHWKVLAKRLNEVNGPKKSPEDWKSVSFKGSCAVTKVKVYEIL